MQQKHKHIRLNRYTTGISLLLVVAAVSAVVVTKHRTDAAPAVKPAAAAVKSQFSFTGTPSWWQGATNGTSMALFHDPHDCFTSVEHKTGNVDVATELQKTQNMLASDGYTVTPGSTQTLTIQTAAGPQQYQLYQSAVTTPAGADKLEGGQEFGYLPVPGGYLKIMGYCDTADELPATIPALQAMKFSEND